MLEIIRRKLFTYTDVWFLDDSYYRPTKCDVCCLIGAYKMQKGGIKSIKYNSLISNIDCEREQIGAQFAKSTKYDLRRSIEDGLSIFHYTSDYLEGCREIYEQFAEMYNEMYRIKGLTAVANVKAIRRAAKSGGVLISCAACEETRIVYHVYVIDGVNARLWMSTSAFRKSEDKKFREKVGRANKRLHYEDMLYFHDIGYKTYDWGGMTSFIEPNGIDRFKMSFGGTPIAYYDETIICSRRYKLYSALKSKVKR